MRVPAHGMHISEPFVICPSRERVVGVISRKVAAPAVKDDAVEAALNNIPLIVGLTPRGGKKVLSWVFFTRISLLAAQLLAVVFRRF